MISPEDQFLRLRSTIERLSRPAGEQESYIDSLGVSIDELALEFDDAYKAIQHMLDRVGVSTDGADHLSSLDAQLEEMSGSERSALWTRQALRESPEWKLIRARAKSALDALPHASGQ